MFLGPPGTRATESRYRRMQTLQCSWGQQVPALQNSAAGRFVVSGRHRATDLRDRFRNPDAKTVHVISHEEPLYMKRNDSSSALQSRLPRKQGRGSSRKSREEAEEMPGRAYRISSQPTLARPEPSSSEPARSNQTPCQPGSPETGFYCSAYDVSSWLHVFQKYQKHPCIVTLLFLMRPSTSNCRRFERCS